MSDRKPAPPQISPYVFPAILAGFGLWCAYDGWLTADPEMLKHQLFNRIAAGGNRPRRGRPPTRIPARRPPDPRTARGPHP